LESVQVDLIDGRICRACRGMLLAHTGLVRILEVSWRAISARKAEATPFHAPDGWHSETMLGCPDCAQPMEKYGYMGIGAIQIDRCEACGLVWLDANELQNMLLALARSNHRSDRAFDDERSDPIGPLLTGGTSTVGGVKQSSEWLFEDVEGAGDVLVAAQVLLRLLRR
jgi:Zn-finger nucleic acid-binding protein